MDTGNLSGLRWRVTQEILAIALQRSHQTGRTIALEINDALAEGLGADGEAFRPELDELTTGQLLEALAEAELRADWELRPAHVIAQAPAPSDADDREPGVRISKAGGIGPSSSSAAPTSSSKPTASRKRSEKSGKGKAGRPVKPEAERAYGRLDSFIVGHRVGETFKTADAEANAAGVSRSSVIRHLKRHPLLRSTGKGAGASWERIG